MATSRKLLVRKGIYQPPQGELVVTPARLRHWKDSFQRMRAAGLRIPIAWGHQPEAVPGDTDDRARKQYYLSRYNAGYLDSLDTDGNDLNGVLSVPGCEVDPDTGNLLSWVKLPDGREVKTAVGEVSIAIKDFTDGQGREWPDSIIHVALTPLPVVDSQTGFEPAKTLGLEACDTPIYLSLTHLLSAEADMPDEFEKDKPEVEGEEGEESAEKKAPAPPPEPVAAPKANHFAAALEVLRANGISLPEDTTEKNLCERILVAGTALATAKAEMEKELEMAKNSATTVDGQDEGASFDGNQSSEEPRPVLMSLSTAKDPFTRKMLAKAQSETRKSLGDRLTKLVKRGLPPARAAELRKQVEGYTLSLDGDGEPAPSQVEYTLSVLEDALPDRAFREHLNGRATAEPRPDRSEDRSAQQEEAANELIQLAGGKVK